MIAILQSFTAGQIELILIVGAFWTALIEIGTVFALGLVNVVKRAEHGYPGDGQEHDVQTKWEKKPTSKNHDDANLAAVTFRRIWGIHEDEREQHEMQVYTEFD